MVLDLRCKASKQVVAKPVRSKIARGDHLLSDTSHPRIIVNKRHTLMICHEDHSEIKAKCCIVTCRKHSSSGRTQEMHKEPENQHIMRNQTDDFQRYVGAPFREEETDAFYPETCCL